MLRRMVNKHFVKGWTEFEQLVGKLEAEKLPINVFFTGKSLLITKLVEMLMVSMFQVTRMNRELPGAHTAILRKYF